MLLWKTRTVSDWIDKLSVNFYMLKVFSECKLLYGSSLRVEFMFVYMVE